MSFYIKNLTGAAIDLDDLGLQLEAGSAGHQTVNVGGTVVGGDATGLTNDATVYTATIAVDGGTPQSIAVTGSLAQTYTALINEINADLTGATAALTGGNIIITSDTFGSGTISITDTDLFSSLTAYVAILPAVAGAGIHDMLYEEAGDVQASARVGGDLYAAINGGDVIVLDPKDGVTHLTIAQSLTVGEIHNDPNWGINGGILNDLDDVDLTGATTGDVLQLGGAGDFVVTSPSVLAGDIALGDLSNVADTASGSPTHDTGEFYVLVGDGAGGYTTETGSTDALLSDYTEDKAGNLIANGTQTDLTLTYNPATNAFSAAVDDNFLRNTGDTLDSGTITIASGASIAVLTGGSITWVDAPVGANDLTNKAYVDALVSSGSKWRDPILDPSLVDVVATNPATPAATYGLSAGDDISLIASASFTFDNGGTTVVATAGTIVNYKATTVGSPETGDYSLINAPLVTGNRFIIAGEHGTIGATLGALDPNSDGYTLDNGDLIEFTGTGDGTSAASWIMPEGRGGQAIANGSGSPVPDEIDQGVTVLVSDPDSTHTGHTYLYDQDADAWLEISGPGAIGAGDGLSYTGSTLNVNFGAGIAQLPTDEVGVDLYDNATSAIILTTDGTTRGATTADKLHLLLDSTTLTQTASGLKVDTQGITETEIHTSVAGLGIAGGNGTALSFAPSELTATATLPADFLVLSDASAAGAPIKRSVTDFLADQDIVTATSDGILVRTAADTYTSRTITASVVAGDEGISIIDGDGVAGNPTIGVDILGQTASAGNLVATDLFLMYDGTNNVALSGQQLADGVSTILGGLGEAYSTIQGDTGSSTASSASDTLRLAGATNGGIVTVAADGTPDEVTFAMDIEDLTLGTGPLVIGDEFAVSDNGTTLKFSFQDLVEDLDIPYNITADGFVVRTADNTFTSRSIEVQGVGAEDGLAVVNGDGIAGNPTIGLDIDNNPAAGEDMVAGDKILAYNLSGVANETFTGQEIANGVQSILGFDPLKITTVNASVGTQDVLTLVDATRSNKNLSVGDTSVNWAENRVQNNDWMQIGSAVDALSGYILPLDATIVKVTAHTSDNNGNTKPFSLYVNGAINSVIGTFNGPSGEDTFEDVTLDIDVSAGDKLRIRAGAGGKIEDTVITLWIKWRG